MPSLSKSHRRSRSNSNPARPPSSTSEQRNGSSNDLGTVEEKAEPSEAKVTEQKPQATPSTPSPATQRSAPKPVGGRRNSWISSLSSKFSSGSTPPSQSSLKASPASPKATSPLDAHNPFGAAYSRRTRKKKRKTRPIPSLLPHRRAPHSSISVAQILIELGRIA